MTTVRIEYDEQEKRQELICTSRRLAIKAGTEDVQYNFTRVEHTEKFVDWREMIVKALQLINGSDYRVVNENVLLNLQVFWRHHMSKLRDVRVYKCVLRLGFLLVEKH